jgi:hypothetical protein
MVTCRKTAPRDCIRYAFSCNDRQKEAQFQHELQIVFVYCVYAVVLNTDTPRLTPGPAQVGFELHVVIWIRRQ